MNIQTTYVRISVVLKNDIKTFPALIADKDNLVVKVPDYASSLLLCDCNIFLEYSDNDGKKKVLCEVVNCKDRSFTLRFAGESELIPDSSYYSVDYKGIFIASSVEEGEISEYIRLASRINSQNQKDISSKIREYAARDPDNAEIFTVLGILNSKIDRILALLERDAEIPNSFDIRCISISGGGFIFFCRNPLKTDTIFVKCSLEGGGVHFNFGSLANISLIRDNIYKAEFINIDEEIRDEIIRFVFARDREILKEAQL